MCVVYGIHIWNSLKRKLHRNDYFAPKLFTCNAKFIKKSGLSWCVQWWAHCEISLSWSFVWVPKCKSAVMSTCIILRWEICINLGSFVLWFSFKISHWFHWDTDGFICSRSCSILLLYLAAHIHLHLFCKFVCVCVNELG